MHVASIGEYAMRQYDLPSRYRSTIGFDRLFSMLDQVSGGEAHNYPPYNIERVGENAYRLTVAAAGFSAGELTLAGEGNAPTGRGGKKGVEDERKTEIVYHGIGAPMGAPFCIRGIYRTLPAYSKPASAGRTAFAGGFAGTAAAAWGASLAAGAAGAAPLAG